MIIENRPVGTTSTRSLISVIGASSVGTLIEWYDFYIFGSLAVVLATKFFPEGNPTAAFLSTLATFAAGFVVRPFGALFFGRLGDLIGRKYTFMVTLLLMGGATFLIGLIPSYATIGFWAPLLVLILRLLQGLALGGEYGGAATYVAEHAPADRRGFWTSWIQTTATAGLFVSLVVILITRSSLSKEAFDDWGWRVPFWASILMVLISYVIRKNMSESPLFAKAKAEGNTSTNPLKESFGVKYNFKFVLLALFGATMGQGVVWYTGQFYAYSFMLSTLKMSIVDGAIVLCTALLLATPFFVYFGSLSDRIGRKRIIMTGLLCGALFTVPIFYGIKQFAGPLTEKTAAVPATVDAAGAAVAAVPAVMQSASPQLLPMIALVFCLVLFVTMAYGPIAAYLVELFPTKVRYTSLSLPYHIGNGVFGGFVPFIATSLTVWAAAQPAGTFQKEHSSLMGLVYPVTIAFICFLIGSALMKDVRNVKLMDEQPAAG